MSIGGPGSFTEDNSPEEPIAPNGAYYVPERDGTVLEYLSNFDKERTPRGFKTFEHFQALVQAGVLNTELPQIHNIRIIYNYGRGDECYTLENLEECEGINLNMHGGMSGMHKIEDILTRNDFRWWEISGIDPKFLRP